MKSNITKKQKGVADLLKVWSGVKIRVVSIVIMEIEAGNNRP